MSVRIRLGAGGSWGNHAEWLKAGEKVTGHRTPIPTVGDEVASAMSSGRIGIYELVAVTGVRDPPDQWFGTVWWKGYADELEPMEGNAREIG